MSSIERIPEVDDARMPTEVYGEPGMFDRLAEMVSDVTARAVFFAACVALIVLWVPSLIFVRDVDTWQLLINTPTTIVTFLLVSVSQNQQARTNAALQHKLNAIALGLLAQQGNDSRAAVELRAAIGLEQTESSS